MLGFAYYLINLSIFLINNVYNTTELPVQSKGNNEKHLRSQVTYKNGSITRVLAEGQTDVLLQFIPDSQSYGRWSINQ